MSIIAILAALLLVALSSAKLRGATDSLAPATRPLAIIRKIYAGDNLPSTKATRIRPIQAEAHGSAR